MRASEIEEFAKLDREEMRRLWEAGEAFTFTSTDDRYKAQTAVINHLLPKLVSFDVFMAALAKVGPWEVEDEIKRELWRMTHDDVEQGEVTLESGP